MPNLMKQWMLGEMVELFREHPNFVLVDYTGLDSEETAALRKTVRDQQLKLRVVKNRVAALAWKELEYDHETLKPLVNGQTAVIVGTTDESSEAVALTKAATALAKDLEKLEIRGGHTDGTALDPKGVEAMSKAPTREELYSKIAGLLQQPAARMIRCVRGPVEKMAGLVLAAGNKFKEEAGEG